MYHTHQYVHDFKLIYFIIFCILGCFSLFLLRKTYIHFATFFWFSYTFAQHSIIFLLLIIHIYQIQIQTSCLHQHMVLYRYLPHSYFSLYPSITLVDKQVRHYFLFGLSIILDVQMVRRYVIFRQYNLSPLLFVSSLHLSPSLMSYA